MANRSANTGLERYRLRWRKQTLRCLALFIAVACVPLSACAGNKFEVRTDEQLGNTGRYLTGVHFVYSYEKDAYYEDDSFAQWARKAGVTVARFPGGTVVKYWDWQNPTGYLASDSWDDPGSKRKPPSNWMSMDEYLHFVEVSGVAPLIGINMLSGVRNDRIDDSVTRAADQVRYVVSKGHEGAFYYLGNEDMSHLGGLEETARIFVRHARAIKSVDPSAKLFWNDDYVNEKRLAKFLAIAGEYADGVEFHGKWWFGEQVPGRQTRLTDWQKQYPFGTEKWGRFSERALQLRRHARALGYPDLMIANNEYGLAPFSKDRFVGFDQYTFGLVLIEFLQDLFVGQFDMAALWTNVPERPSGSGKAGLRLINTDAGNRLNPVHFGFELLSSAQDKRLVRTEGGGPSGYGFAVLSDNQLQVFLLNKSGASQEIDVRITGKTLIGADGVISSMVDTADNWGRLNKATIRAESQSFKAVLPPLSYSRIELPVVQDTEHQLRR